MNKLFKIINKIISKPFELYSNFFVRDQLKNDLEIENFYNLNGQYQNLFFKFNSVEVRVRKSQGYEWDSWSGKIRNAFINGVNLGFLSNPLIAYTMVYGGTGGAVRDTSKRISFCRNILGDNITRLLLREDYIGLPIISNAKFLTSANRSHHSSHLAAYYQFTGKQIWNANVILEWGGGYGGMARIVRRMNPGLTYIIVDLPELLALQYIYLGALEGADNINIIRAKDGVVAPGKINLVSSEMLASEEYEIKCDVFISTWALTECPKQTQFYVVKQNYFSAQEIFLASHMDENNHLENLQKHENIKKLAVPHLNGCHEYWLINKIYDVEKTDTYRNRN